jgi:hypothetical protein
MKGGSALSGSPFFCFLLGFWRNWVLDVVILWTECGGLCGEYGLWNAGFVVVDFMQG